MVQQTQSTAAENQTTVLIMDNERERERIFNARTTEYF